MKLRYGVGAVAVLAASLAACGGGSTGSGGGYTPSTPAAPTTASTSAPISTTTSSTVLLPRISNGTAATVTLPAANASTTATVSLQSALPSGAPQPKAVHSRGRYDIGAGTIDPLAYVLVSVGSTVSITSTPAFDFSLEEAPPSGSSLYIAVLDLNNASAGWNVLLGPGTVSGSSISFAAQTLAPPLTLQANDTYVFALVATGAPVPTAPPTIAPDTTASYAGTKSVSFTYGYYFDYPQPGPTATVAPVTMNYNVATSVSIGASPFPGKSTAQLVDEHVAETDSGNVSAGTYSTDSWISLGTGSSGYDELLYGQTIQEPSSANLPVVTTLYGTPQIVDELPETNGASWSNAPQSTVNYSYASGDAGTRTVANDGTYTDVEQMGPASGGGTATLTENADGSGSIAGPFFGGGIIDSIGFSAPTPMPSASPQIDVTIAFSQFAQQNYGLPASQVLPDDVWYPYTPGQPLSFYNETDTVKTGAALPSSCSSSPYDDVNDVRRTIVSLDTVIGDMETTQLDSYNVNGFPVCLVTSDVLSYAYDEQGTTPYFIYLGTQLGLETVTTNETLVIQNQPDSSTSTALRKQQTARAQAFAAALQGHILDGLARDRAAHVRSFVKALKTARSFREAMVQGGRR